MLCEALPVSHVGIPWTDDDDAKLASLHLQEPIMPPARIAALMGRTPSSILMRLNRLRIRRVEGGRMRKCLRHDDCGNTIYSTWSGERLCYGCKKKNREYA